MKKLELTSDNVQYSGPYHYHGDETQPRFYSAMWDSATHKHIVGCPCGSGETKQEALADLINRTERESNVSIQIV